MGDLIDRQSVIDAITDTADKFDWPDDYHQAMKEGIRVGTLICSLMPSKQPEIIYCRECKYWDPFPSSSSAPEYHHCKRFGGMLMGGRADDFCSYAERREAKP